MSNRERVLKLAEACLKVASDVEKGKLRMKDLRRSTVFFDNGACGCAFGHALSYAGLRSTLSPYFIRGSAGGKSPRWTDNLSAYEAATRCLAPKQVQDQLVEVELANDAHNGDDRKILVVRELRTLAAMLDVEARGL